VVVPLLLPPPPPSPPLLLLLLLLKHLPEDLATMQSWERNLVTGWDPTVSP
jgi:hypothetical protein